LAASKTIKLFFDPDPKKRAKRDAILDMTLLGSLIRNRPDEGGFVVYKALPGVVASEILQRAIKDFEVHKKGLKAYYKNPKKFTGKPRPPSFKDKHGRSTLVFTGNGLGLDKGGLPPADEPDFKLAFPALKTRAGVDRTVHADYAKTAALTAADMAAFSAYDLQGRFDRIKASNKAPAEAGLCEIRLVSQRDKRVKVEFVVKWRKAFPKGSVGEKAYRHLESIDPKMASSRHEGEILKMLAAMKAADLPIMAGSDPGVNNLISVAVNDGQDAMVISPERLVRRLKVFDDRIDALKSELTTPELRELQRRRDEAQKARRAAKAALEAEQASALAQEEEKNPQATEKAEAAKKASKGQGKSKKAKTAAASAAADFDEIDFEAWADLNDSEIARLEAEEALAAGQDSTHALSPAEFTAFKKGLAAIHQDSRLIELLARREAMVDDFFHKASRGVIRELTARKVELFVLGHNPLWKNQTNMGVEQNKRFCGLAHTKLFHMLKYKGLAAGILVVEVEESYTSQTSFVLNEPLRKHFSLMTREERTAALAAKKARQSQQSQQTAAQAAPDATPDGAARADSSPETPTTGANPPARGKTGERATAKAAHGTTRGTGNDRHKLTSPGAKAEWLVVHADVNGAFNILRKACPAFQCHEKLSLRHKLWWVSPKTGLSPMNLRREKRAS